MFTMNNTNRGDNTAQMLRSMGECIASLMNVEGGVTIKDTAMTLMQRMMDCLGEDFDDELRFFVISLCHWSICLTFSFSIFSNN